VGDEGFEPPTPSV